MASDKRIPHSRVALDRRVERAAIRVLRSGRLAGGREVERLEHEFAERLGFRAAVAVATGTAALHLSQLALGIGRGDTVACPTYVCAAVLNAIRHAGAQERLIDAAPNSFHASPTTSELAGANAAIVPHLFGEVAPLSPFAAVPVIEDCAMALGAVDGEGKPAGHQGRAAIYSFYATKAIAAGEGGMVATDDASLAAEVRDLREYDKKDSWRVRFNYKLTDLQAAVLRPQLAALDRIVARRRALAEKYNRLLQGSSLVLPHPSEGASCFRYVVRTKRSWQEVSRHYRGWGIDVARPVHRPLHQLLGQPTDSFPNAEHLFLTAFSLPIYPSLSVPELRRVVAASLAL